MNKFRDNSNEYHNFKSDCFKCPYPKCNFEGSVNILTIHVNLHIQNTNSETAEEFRNNRKKRFSSHSRVLLRKASLLEEWNRGERAGLKLKRRTDNFGNTSLEVIKAGLHLNTGNAKGRKFQRKKKQISFEHYKDLLLESDDETKNGIQAFKGYKTEIEAIGGISDEETNHICISDEEDWDCAKESLTTNFASALGSLCNYDSDSDKDSINEPCNSIIESSNATPKGKVINCQSNIETTSSDLNSLGNDENDKIDINRTLKRKCKDDISSNINKPKFKRNKIEESLLQKLLGPQITHERNIILQCLSNIVKNNFLQS